MSGDTQFTTDHVVVIHNQMCGLPDQEAHRQLKQVERRAAAYVGVELGKLHTTPCDTKIGEDASRELVSLCEHLNTRWGLNEAHNILNELRAS